MGKTRVHKILRQLAPSCARTGRGLQWAAQGLTLRWCDLDRHSSASSKILIKGVHEDEDEAGGQKNVAGLFKTVATAKRLDTRLFEVRVEVSDARIFHAPKDNRGSAARSAGDPRENAAGDKKARRTTPGLGMSGVTAARAAHCASYARKRIGLSAQKVAATRDSNPPGLSSRPTCGVCQN
jgi:hypothetical protein